MRRKLSSRPHARRALWLLPALLLALHAGCSTATDGSNAAQPLPQGALESQPPRPRERAAARAPRAEPPAPRGIYFLHEGEFGVAACVLIGDRTAGSAPLGYDREAGEDRSRVVLEMAEEARGAGGNVVLLPRFREDFAAGRLSGRVYRCAEPLRRSIYARAAAEQRLTVVP